MLIDKLKTMKFDKRIVEYNIRTGQVTEEEYKQYLQSLNNDEGNMEKLDLEGGASSNSDLLE